MTALLLFASGYTSHSGYPVSIATHCSAPELHLTRCDRCAADYIPRIVLSSTTFADRLVAATCEAVPYPSPEGPVDAPTVPVTAELLWEQPDPVDIATQGCVPDAQRFYTQVARFTLSAAPEEGLLYCIKCDGLDLTPLCWASFGLSNEPAAAPPDLEVVEVSIEPGGIDQTCADDALLIEVAGVERAFLEEGGYFELDYGAGRHDIANTAEYGRVLDPGVVGLRPHFFAPLPDDEFVRLRVVNAAGLEGPWIDIDVRGLGTAMVERNTCSTAPSGLGGFSLVALIAILFGSRRRRGTG